MIIEFVSPVFNAEKYVGKCIRSVANQDNNNWKMHIINDASTDNTLKVIHNTINEYDINKFNVINNSKRKTALPNLHNAIMNCCDDESIIAFLGGDDWLLGTKVVDVILSEYQNNNLWVIWTQHKHYPSGKVGSCKNMSNSARQRTDPTFGWCASSLITFRKKLYNHIDEKDLKDANGNFYTICADLAIMFPMLEMAGPEHRKFINKMYYVYNKENPLNDYKIRANKQRKIGRIIRKQRAYKPLEHL